MEKDVRIVESSGSFRLVERAGRFAVIELRDGRAYPLAGGRDAEGLPADSGGMALAAAGGWTGEDEARRRFAELAARGDDLAREIW